MAKECYLSLKGHIIDSLTLTKVMDLVQSKEAQCTVEEIKVAEDKTGLSFARIKIKADTEEQLALAIEIAKKHGAVLSVCS